MCAVYDEATIISYEVPHTLSPIPKVPWEEMNMSFSVNSPRALKGSRTVMVIADGFIKIGSFQSM